MNYHHLSIEERSCIRKYYVDGQELSRDCPVDWAECEYEYREKSDVIVHICTTFQLTIRTPHRRSIC